MTSDDSFLVNYTAPLSPITIHTANGSWLPATKIGSIISSTLEQLHLVDIFLVAAFVYLSLSHPLLISITDNDCGHLVLILQSKFKVALIGKGNKCFLP